MKNSVKDIENLLMNSNLNTPLRHDAFLLSDEEKIEIIEHKFRDIMHTLGLDLNDDSLQNTPNRVAKMFVQEIFQGLNPKNMPNISLFDNKYDYQQVLLEKNIQVTSTCEHHFLPIVGKAHIAYIPSDKVIGLSKLNRVVKYFSKRPQVQERLTLQIANHLQNILETEHIAVIIDAVHYCIVSRGVEDTESATITSEFRGQFKDYGFQDKLFRMLNV